MQQCRDLTAKSNANNPMAADEFAHFLLILAVVAAGSTWKVCGPSNHGTAKFHRRLTFGLD